MSEIRTRFCYYVTDSGTGTASLCDVDIPSSDRKENNYRYYEAIETNISISVSTADEEDGEPQGQFSFVMRCKNIPDKMSDRKYDVALTGYFTKEELKRLHAVFGLLLEIG